MKDLHGQASETTAASVEDCFALLAAVDGYPLWYPDVVREVDVLGLGPEGYPSNVRAKFRVAYGRFAHDFDLVLGVTLEEPVTVRLDRVGGTQRFDLAWDIREDGATRIALDLRARLRVPRLLPVERLGNATAAQFVAAAKAAVDARQ